jgi:hypothetical protein
MVFAFLRKTGNRTDEATIIKHIAPRANDMGYRARKMKGVPYRFEAYFALKTLQHGSLVENEDGLWRLTEKGRMRATEITEGEADEMRRERAAAEKGQGRSRRAKISD